MTFDWTDAVIDRMRVLWLDGMSASQIANAIGAPSRNSVIGKLHRLGWTVAAREEAIRERSRAARVVAAPVAPPPPPKPPATPAGQPIGKWSDEDVETLRRGIADGKTHDHVAEAVNRSRHAVKQKCYALGLSYRALASRKPGPVVAAPAAAEPIVVDIVMRRVTLAEIGHGECRWPIGDPKDEDFAYCGLPADGPWCAGHARLAYRGAVPSATQRPTPRLLTRREMAARGMR